MKVYGIKDAEVQTVMSVMEVVETLPPSAEQGKVLFLKGRGICVFVDGGWDLMPLDPRFRTPGLKQPVTDQDYSLPHSG